MIRFRPYTYGIAAFLVLVLLAGGGIVAFQTYWPAHVSVTELPQNAAVFSRPPGSARIAILRSEATAQFLHSGGGYEAHARYWKDLLTRAGWTSNLIEDNQLLTDLSSYSALILPSAICLSAKQEDAIRAFLRQGNGVIATWSTGTRDEKCDWVGWQFLKEITAADAFETSERPAPWYISFAAGNPITAGIPEGNRVQIESAERVSATALAVDAYWSDFRLFPVDSKLPAEFLGSVLHHRFEHNGRVVWLGFQENAAVAGGLDKHILDVMLLNATAWARGATLAAIDPWPAPYSTAVLMALNLEAGADNARYAAETLLRNHARGVFYCAVDHLRNNPALLQALGPAGEIGCQGWQPQGGLEPRQQWRLWYDLWRSRRQLRQLSNSDVAGFFPLHERLRSAAIPMLAASHYRYFLVGAEGNSVMPQILSVSAQWGPVRRQWPLLRLVRMGDDDLSLSPLGLTGLDQDWVVERILADAEVISSLGGLYVFGYHSQGLSAPEYSAALGRVVQGWQAQRAWIATGSDVTDWWLSRQQLSVGASTLENGALRLTITYTGRDPIDGAVLSIYCPTETPNLSAAVAKAGASSPELIVDAEHQRLQLRLPRLVAGSYIYELR